MRIAIIEPYYGGSHQAWADGYRAHSEHEVRLFTHEARFWKWRMHGSYVTLAEEFVVDVDRHGAFDVILASDMLHLPAFLGSIGAARGDAAVALYMHENQLTYPLSPRDTVDEAYAMINWASMTVADSVLFNSQFHHDVWFGQIAGQLRRFPDYKHSDLLPAVQARAEVLGVGVDLRRLDGAQPLDTPAPLILWNQRWDFDKGPDRFADAMIALARSHDFVIALAGEEIGEIPAFTRLQEVLAARMFHVGFAAEETYRRLLAASDVVVSTATQEFFGIAITEAIYAGAFPVLPNALVYPERIPRGLHRPCLYDSDAELLERLGWALEHPEEAATIAAALKPAMAKWDWSVMAPRYDDVLAGVRGA
jgi:glycosyltransferase involved in cell wall biosynthesis